MWCPGATSHDEEDSMKITLNAVGILAMIIGGIWILQGVGILPGSFMSGQMKWAINGAIAAAAGLALIIVANFVFKKSRP
jgi:hypothetical protein